MMEKVMFVGAGQGGCKVVDNAKALGYSVVYLNLSANDLRALNNAEEHEQLLIRGDGAGKDREYAKSMLDINLVIKFFHEQLRNRDIKLVLFAFSTGGGSGSGISPIVLEALMYEFHDIVFVALPILPDFSESYVSQVNTLQAIQELSDLDLLVFPIDNQQALVNASMTTLKLHETVNDQVISAFHKIFLYTTLDSNIQFDETDLLKVFSTPGTGIIAEADVASISKSVNLTQEGINKAIHSSWEHSIFAPIEYEYLTSAAVILDGQESLMNQVQVESFFDKFKAPPLYTFNGAYHEQNGKIVTILTGLSWCKRRMKQIEDLIEQNKNQYDAVVSGSKKYEVGSGIKELIGKTNNKSPVTKSSNKPNWRELVNKYNKQN